MKEEGEEYIQVWQIKRYEFEIGLESNYLPLLGWISKNAN